MSSRFRRQLTAIAAALALAPAVVVRADSPGANVSTVLSGANARAIPTWSSPARFADFGAERPSSDARQLADWIADSRDTGGTDFLIVDKKFARVYVFDGDARLRGASVVLLGEARGDESAPGIGDRPLAQVRPQEKTTPAGRFIAERGHDARGEDVVWIDYDAAVSMHRVLTTNARERRLARLASPALDDKRISFGCINVPVAFYESIIQPVFAEYRAVVYVLPEVKTIKQVFGSYDVAAAHRPAASLAVRPSCSDASCAGALRRADDNAVTE